ncbi:hypothetical protein CUTA107171_17030 [Cupriavidus taiwanensis]
MGHAGVGHGQHADFLRVDGDEVREPDVGAQPVVVGDELHRRALVFLAAEFDVVVGLGQVRMQPQVHAAAKGGQFAQQGGRQREGWGRRGHHHAAQAVGGGVVVAGFQALDIGQHFVQRLGHQRGGAHAGMIGGRLDRAASAQHQAHAQLFSDFEQHVAGFRAVAVVIQVVMVGASGGAGEQQLGHAQPHRGAEDFGGEARQARVGDRGQPLLEPDVHAAGHGLQQVLEQVVVGVDPAWVDHAARGVEHGFAVVAWQDGADLGDAAVADADVGGAGARGIAGTAGHHGGSVADQQGAGRRGGGVGVVHHVFRPLGRCRHWRAARRLHALAGR